MLSQGSQVADRSARKINYVSDRIAVLGAGSAADNQILARYITNYMNSHA
jgi:20S proteasome alpha/beta subunit